jgi:HPr kinase/phosphorylase
MTDTPTVGALFQRYAERLDLGWIAGRAGRERPLGSVEGTKGKSLVGHLNVIHPNRLQILGHLEFDYLGGLDEPAQQELFRQVCLAQPAAIIVAEGLDIPADLATEAEQSDTPLLFSPLSSQKLIGLLRHYLGAELAEKTVLHGVFMEVNGMGVLLCGESGVGKSELALELITRGHRLVADDAPEFFRVGPDTVRGRCPEVLRDFLEVRGLGLLDIRNMFGDSAIKPSKDLRLIVHLARMREEDIRQVDRLQGSYRQRTVLDVELPEVTIPVASGRNLAVLVEAAARNHILLRKGYNALEAFMQRQRNQIQKNST